MTKRRLWSAWFQADAVGERTLGLFLAPLIPCHIPPPIVPIANAPPKSFRMTYGLRSIQMDGWCMIRRTRDLASDRRATWWTRSEGVKERVGRAGAVQDRISVR